jgi:endonuclease-8
MPEGDTVHRTASRLHEALAGRRLLGADLRWPELGTADLAGMRVDEVRARGKHILARFDSGWTLRSHLRMEGEWYVLPTDSVLGRTGAQGSAHSDTPGGVSSGAAPGGSARSVPHRFRGSQVRAVLVAPEWTALGLQLGMLDLVRTAEEHTIVGHLGPDLLDPGFDADRAAANLAASGDTIGGALLDQRNLAGIGTLWACESLFCERIPPWTSTTDLPIATICKLVARAHRLMNVNVKYAVQSSTGERRPGHETYVHARSGRPCRRCGTTVRVSSIGPPTRERPMFYCPGCQGGLAPTDDGRPIAPLGANRRGNATGRPSARP